jgi:hypothetical protein
MSNCKNCGRYPFCDKIVNVGYCKDYIEGLKGDCVNCLGCNKLEDKNFKGTYNCKNRRY